MSIYASGTFDVTMNPQPPYDTAEGATLGHVSISKQFQGDLVASSMVEMLSGRHRGERVSQLCGD